MPAERVTGEVVVYLDALGMHPTDERHRGGEQFVAVFLGTQPREAWGVHPRPDALIDGLSGTATRAEAREHLGEPVWESDADDRFRIGDDYLQLHYGDDRIQIVIAAIRERG